MAYSASSTSIVEELETKIERQRQRIEALEAIVIGNAWNEPVAPLTLQETRFLRLIARRAFGVMPQAALEILSGDYSLGHEKHLSVLAYNLRRKLPDGVAPLARPLGRSPRPFQLPDRQRTLEFLGEAA